MLMKDKTAIITGAASGIGLEIARAYVRQGARVAIADLSADAAAKAAAELNAASGSNMAIAMAVTMDVSNEDAVQRGFDQVTAAWGTPNVLISNAGIQHIAPIDELSLADWKRMLAIHLDGAFLTTRAFVRGAYPSGKGGAVIYMGSVHSHLASVLKAPYVTAKHGLLGLCRVVAKEGAKYGVRSNVISPGFVRTPLVDKQIPEQAKELGISEDDVIRKVMLKDTVDGEFTTTADVAELAVFLAAFPSNALTGQSVVVSHGWHME